MKNIDQCLQRQNFTQDKFQTYVCWMLLAGALFAMIPPIAVVVTEQRATGTCAGTDFVIYAHYSTHDWLIEQFEKFKAGTRAAFPDVCYELKIEDSALRVDTKPSIWIPETSLWLDIAENDLGPNSKLVLNRTRDCTDTTRVPFGIITWKKMAKVIIESEFGNESNTDSQAIPFTVISDLAQNDWTKYPEIKEAYPVSAFYIAHGHPNVTSGGLLGAVTGYTSLLTTAGSWDEDYGVTYTSEDCVFSDVPARQAAYDQVVNTMSDLEKKVTATTPIDYTLPGFMMSRGPLYLHMTYGFENDVAYLNEKFKDQMLYLWNDSLAFLYLEDTFKLEYPICKLTGASWYTDDVGIVADAFVDWIKDTGATKDLLDYGFRPIGVPVNESSIINKDNGCNPDFDIWGNVKEFEYVEVNTAKCMQTLYQTHKKDLQLTVLLDVSGNLQESVGDGVTQWNALSEALPLIPKVLGLNDKINLTCFEDYIIEGPGGGCATTSYPNGTLKYSRSALVDYFSNDIAPRAKQNTVNIFETLNETFLEVAEAVASFEKNQFRYVILVITEDDNKDDANTRAQSLLDTIGLEFNPNQIHVYPILYFGTESGLTANTLEEIATRTNGQFSIASDDDIADIIEEFAYYW